MRRLGAAAGYLCWLLAPVAMLAVALPHPAADAQAVRVDVSAITPAWIAAAPVEGATRGGMAATLVAATWSSPVNIPEYRRSPTCRRRARSSS